MMNRLMLSAGVAFAWTLLAQGASAQTGPIAPSDDRPSTLSDDIGEDGLKRRGDGSIDDNGIDDDIGEDGLKHRGDGSIDDDQGGDDDSDSSGRGSNHERGRDRDEDDREDRSGRSSDHERGRDRDRDTDRGRDRDRGHGRDD